jgi:WD40 repeat-containing protein SMU1
LNQLHRGSEKTTGFHRLLSCFSKFDGLFCRYVEVHDADPVGICHHPHRNLVATISSAGLLRMWKP